VELNPSPGFWGEILRDSDSLSSTIRNLGEFGYLIHLILKDAWVWNTLFAHFVFNFFSKAMALTAFNYSPIFYRIPVGVIFLE